MCRGGSNLGKLGCSACQTVAQVQLGVVVVVVVQRARGGDTVDGSEIRRGFPPNGWC